MSSMSFHFIQMVGLSDINSNKYNNILSANLQMSERNNSSNISIANSPRQRNEYGEIEVQKCTEYRKTFSETQISEMVTVYSQNKNVSELAKQYGCSRNTIAKTLRKASVQIIKEKAQESLDAEDVIEMYKEYQYHTIAEIGKKYNVSSSAITRCLKKNGIVLRSRWDYPNK